MIEPKREDIAKFRSYDVEQFERWLRVGFEGYFIDNAGVRNFRPVEYCILHEHTLSGDLRVIFDAFSSDQQAMIREAVTRLLERLPVEEKYVPIFRELLDLAVVVRAHEIFKVIPARGGRFLALDQESPDTPSLYSMALDVVTELGDQSEDARDCIERLIGTPGAFSPDYARTALIALCKIAPDDLLFHMALLREPLAQNFRKYRPTQQAQQLLVHDIMKAPCVRIDVVSLLSRK